MEENRYYSGNVVIPTTEAEVVAPSLAPTDPDYKEISDIAQTNYYRLRLAYDKIDSVNSISIKYANPVEDDAEDVTFKFEEDTDTHVFNDNATADTEPAGFSTFFLTVFEDETEWANSNPNKLKEVGPEQMVFIRQTGDLIFGDKVAARLKANEATIDIQYDKTGFEYGRLRPEYYYNCTKLVDETGANLTKNNVFTKFDENGKVINFDIEYTIAANQTIAINTEASDVFDSSLQRDLGEMIESARRTIAAYDKLDTIKTMMGEDQYASDADQEWLAKWKDAVQKEYDYFKDDMRKLFDAEIGKTTKYYDTITLALTDLGCKGQSLELTKTRVGDQRETVQDLQSKNDDIDLSQIIIDYTAAHTAYQASLTAAGKLSDSTLLNYI
jgi:flagellar hook-associated protein 3 FlgL